MKQHFIFAILLVFIIASSNSHAQEGYVNDNLSMKSKILKTDKNYAIYLPPDYNSSERSYPILYLLHGATDNHTGWVQFGEVKHITDKAIKEGKATPMIIVMPDADTKRMGYNNTIDGKWDYEDFFFEEFMPYIEDKYRVKKEKRYRAISGLSMGGGGTLFYAMHHPELFSSACPLSAWVGYNSVEDVKRYNDVKTDKYSDKEYQDYISKYSALRMSEEMEVKDLNSVRWYIDCGDDDFLYEGNSLLHINFKKRGVNHEYRVRDGAHTWTYWRESLPEVLSFISDAFHQY